MKAKSKHSLALVLSGGGAKGAYEAGVIHYIRTMLPQKAREVNFSIQCGSSVGAINACFMASTADDLQKQGREIVEFWRALKTDQIYRRDSQALTRFLFSSAEGMFFNLISRNHSAKNHQQSSHFRALFDTTPFAGHLKKIIRWEKIHENVKKGIVQAVALVVTRMRTGEPEIFLQEGSRVRYTGKYKIYPLDLEPKHAMASAAIPLVFPPIYIDPYYYVDGGMRLNTPLSPAIQLGATRMLLISLNPPTPHDPHFHLPSEKNSPPNLGEHFGKLLNSFFLDRLKYDIEQLERINNLIEVSQNLYGADYLKQTNAALGKKGKFRKIDYLNISPSTPLTELFKEWYESGNERGFNHSLMERVLMRLLDINPAINEELLSYLTFEKGYLSRVIDLGFEDAKKQHHHLISFLEKDEE